MDNLVFPDIFDDSISAFFTKKILGVNVKEICNILSIRKDAIYFPVQKHTDKIQVIETDLNSEIADAVITKQRGILIGVRVADCVPILISNRRGSLVGVVHAGWRGTATQIIKKTIRVVVKGFQSPPKDIIIALGPSIRWSCYYVKRDVRDAIFKATGEGEYIQERDGGYFIDLPSANMYQALSMDIPKENIWISPECTYCSPEDYYSFRYCKGHTGKQGGFIGIF